MRGKVLAFLAPFVLLISIAAMQSNVWHVVNGVLTGPGFVTSGPILNSSGTASAPSYSFASFPTQGIYAPASGTIYVTFNGTVFAFTNSAELILDAVGTVKWGSSGVSTPDIVLGRGAAGVVTVAANQSYGLGAAPMFTRTAPTIGSGFGTSPSITASNGTAAFTINVGTGGTASAGVVTMPAATTGWNCSVEDRTAVLANAADRRTLQIATTTTSVTFENQTISTGAVVAWTASDVLAAMCVGY